MQNPEQTLVARLRGKDKRAFELVFNDYFGLLKTYALRFVDQSEEAEEIVQDVFFRFWEKCESIAPDSTIKSYLYRSVHNTALNHLKHQKVKDAYRQYVIGFMEEAVEDTASAGDDDLRGRITSAIDELPARCAEIFRLSRFEGLKYQEIATHLDISVKTVEVQMGKALKLLREKLKDIKTG